MATNLNLTVEEYDLWADPKYRAYVSSIDKSLKNFESTSEWADLISALGKLNKVLLAHADRPVVPRRIVISKRLAQCMHPALPSGVHLKALETYDIIFRCIGTTRLSQELFIYSAGLFPLLANAAMNVRPALLNIYESHFIPLEEKLRPGLPGFLNGVLPGLEEGSEYFGRTNLLLEKVCAGVCATYFYGCLWECVLANSSIRLPAVSYVLNHFNRRVTIEDQLYIMGSKVEIMVQALSAAVLDQSVLVQRCTLDFLLVAFPFNSGSLIHSDLERIVTSAVNVVLRRDMSLNRRLYLWLLGSESHIPATDLSQRDGSVTSSDSDVLSSYFDNYSKDVLIRALLSCLKGCVQHSVGEHGLPCLKPYRLLVSLLDKPEIGQAVLDDILIDVFRSLYAECKVGKSASEQHTKHADHNHQGEILKTANLLFGTLEPHYIWQYLGQHFQSFASSNVLSHSKVCDGVQAVGSCKPSVVELCLLTEFLLDIVSIETYIEVQVEHLPELLRSVSTMLSALFRTLSASEVTCALRLSSHLLSKIQLPVVSPTNVAGPAAAVAGSSQGLDCGNVWLERGEAKSEDDEAEEEEQEAKEEEEACGVSVRPFAILRSCVTAFEDCFVRLFAYNLFAPLLDWRECLQHLLVVQRDNLEERRERVEQLLWAVVSRDDVRKPRALSTDDARLKVICRDAGRLHVELSGDANKFAEAFSIACQILVDFSSVPVCVAVGVQNKGPTEWHSREVDDLVVSDWLRLLIVVSCCVREVDFQLVAVGCLLELMGLAQSSLHAAACNDGIAETPSTCETYSVVIDPLLDARHLNFIHKRTFFSPVVARILWGHVGQSDAKCLQRSVELLHQLHNLSPDSGIVEDVIGESMANDDEKNAVTSVQKFSILWHLSRDISLRASPTGKARLFDRSLLVMLNCLNKPFGSQRSEVLSWLTHSLQRGDIGAILEPILLILLHPDTARVSVQHVSIHSHKTPRQEEVTALEDGGDADDKIFAISSVEGQVIYHVGSRGKTLPIALRPTVALSSLASSEGGRSIGSSGVGVGSSGRVVVTSHLSDFDLPLSCERASPFPDPICVTVNPLVSSSWGDGLPASQEASSSVDLGQAHRIDVSAIRHASSFDDVELMSSHNASDNLSLSLPSLALRSGGGGDDQRPAVDLVASIVDELLDSVFSVGDDDTLSDERASAESSGSEFPPAPPPPLPPQTRWDALRDVSVHPLHSYLLLYSQCYDSRRVLYALSTLKGVLQANARAAVCAMATTGIGTSRSQRQALLHDLLARHRKAIFGKGFQGELDAAARGSSSSSMYLEVVVTVCLYYIRSFYPNLAHMRLRDEDLADNWQVQLLSVELLSVLFAEVATVVRDSGKGFASYMSNLLAKSKVQKTVLHCVLAGILRVDPHLDGATATTETFTEAIIRFNEADAGTCDFQETFHIGILRLLLVLVILEDQLANHDAISIELSPVAEARQPRGGGGGSSSSSSSSNRSQSPPQPQSHLRYQPGALIPCQPIFQTALQAAMKQPYTSPLHRHWLGLVSCLLPFLRKALANTVVTTVTRLCCNLEHLAQLYAGGPRSQTPLCELKGKVLPIDHVVLQLEGLTTLCHYCLLDNNNLVSTVLAAAAQSSSASVTSTSHGLMSGPNATQIISNLINVFVPSVMKRDAAAAASKVDPLLIAKHNLLGHLPRLVSSLATLWASASDSASDGRQQASWIMGTPKVIQQHILELLSPLSHHHGVNFLAAVAVAFNEKRLKHGTAALPHKKVISPCSDEQLSLVELVRAIKVMPMEIVIQLVRQVVKQPPVPSGKKKGSTSVDVIVLQFFHAYIQSSTGLHLVESWLSIQNLIKDALQMTNFCPSALFFLLGILNEFVQRAPALDDRKDQKDLQELTQKLIETCSSVAGASLEQTTWLRRNLAVKPGPQTDLEDLVDSGVEGTRSGSASPVRKSPSAGRARRLSEGSANSAVSVTASYSVQALSILADLLAPLLDVVYQSEEKDKVLPLLAALMYNVTPYLRNHRPHNIPSFRVCSQLIASISGYQYTRRAWRRDVLELLLDPAFFQMESGCLRPWRTIIDNLMTHDKTTFLDLMARVSIAQSGSLSLFSSKEQEYEQRAQLLKRLAFVIFCSEVDQYQGYLPEIQERLTESLRLPQVPNVQAQVFLCFRVLLLRMVPQHITSLWPIIITEMVQVFLQIEQELCKGSREFSSHLHRLSTLDTSWVVSSSNGLNAHSHPAWLQLYLSVCKLLDLCLCLPADKLPQFQMYSWAFVGDHRASFALSSSDRRAFSRRALPPTEFTPHVVRLAKLMSLKESGGKLPYVPGRPLLSIRHIKTLFDLQPFFETVASLGLGEMNLVQTAVPTVEDDQLLVVTSNWNGDRQMASVEGLLAMDFLEPLPA